MLTYGSVCSGIEAASVAWEPLGFRPSWFSEIESFPSAVLAHHWPEVENLGDMTKIRDMVELGLVNAPDILVGGTPCQSFSLAGLRNGLSDDRGQLTLEYVRLADAIDAERKQQKLEPAIIVWENVPGVLTSKDNAFGYFLAGLTGEDDPLVPAGKKWTNAGCVFGPERTVAWRVLDAQYFGVAQRRRRVFVIASARKGFDPAALLFEFKGVRRDSAPSREARTEITGNADAGISSGTEPELMATLCATDNEKWGSNQWVSEGKAVLQPIAYGIPGNWIGRSPENGGNATEPHHDRSPCLTATDRHGVAHDMAVRRLTPVEYERLQGFPDNHTKIDDSTPDGNRYKALGNSMAVPCMRWIGYRIQLEIERTINA